MADLAARTMTRLGRPDALAAFADAIASFAHESAAANLLADAPAHHTRAWAVSAAVITADAILIGQWYGARRRRRRRRRRRQQDEQRTPSPFALGEP
jgi:hypothetical protein